MSDGQAGALQRGNTFLNSHQPTMRRTTGSYDDFVAGVIATVPRNQSLQRQWETALVSSTRYKNLRSHWWRELTRVSGNQTISYTGTYIPYTAQS